MKRFAPFACAAWVSALPAVGHAQTASPPLQAGGLAPPSSTTDDESARTEQKLDDADRKDSGRGLEWVWLNVEGGFEHLGLQTFKSNKLVDSRVVGTTQTGGMVGVGAGLRLVFITIGPRFRVGLFDQYQLWTLDAELGLRIPLGSIEPYLTLAGGYASLGAFSAKNIGDVSGGDVSITGYDIRAGGGLDYYVTPVFSLGAALTGEMVGLTRPGVSLSKISSSNTDPNAASANVYAASGSSIGFGVTGTAVVGLHF